MSCNVYFIFTGNRPESVEKCLKKSLSDLSLSYVDLYLIHVPFGFPESDGQMLRHPNGDVVLDLTTDHLAIWKVRINQSINHFEQLKSLNSKLALHRNWRNLLVPG